MSEPPKKDMSDDAVAKRIVAEVAKECHIPPAEVNASMAEERRAQAARQAQREQARDKDSRAALECTKQKPTIYKADMAALENAERFAVLQEKNRICPEKTGIEDDIERIKRGAIAIYDFSPIVPEASRDLEECRKELHIAPVAAPQLTQNNPVPDARPKR